MKNIFPFIILFLVSSFQSAPLIVRIKVPTCFSGWAFLVGTSRNELVKKTTGNYYVLNQDGIAYIDRNILDKDFSVEYFKDNKRLTSSDVKYYSSWERMSDNDRKKVFLFYVLNRKELNYPEQYWENSETFKKYRAQERQHLDMLVNKKKIKF